MPWKATCLVAEAVRSENFAKMPPIGVSSPAPDDHRIRPPLATKIAARYRPAFERRGEGHRASRFTLAARTRRRPPRRAQRRPGRRPCGAAHVTKRARPRDLAAATDGRQEHDVSSGVDGGESRLASTPDDDPGSGRPARATGGAGRPTGEDPLHGPSIGHRGGERDVAVVAKAGVGCLPKPDSRPTPGMRSPSPGHREDPISAPEEDTFVAAPRPSLAKKATSPRALTGATTGSSPARNDRRCRRPARPRPAGDRRSAGALAGARGDRGHGREQRENDATEDASRNWRTAYDGV